MRYRLLPFLLACGPSTPATGPAERPTSQAESRALPALGDASVVDQDALVRGTTMTELTARYGEPTRTHTFEPYDGMSEFRIEIGNTYRPGSDRAKGVTITEHTYEESQTGGSKTFFTIWYHRPEGEWVGLQAVSYSDGVDF